MTNRKTGNQKRKYSFNRYEDIDKCIWKVFDNFGHDEKIENLVYWTRKLKKERAAFRKKAVKYDELQNILEEYNVTPENIREVLLTGQMFRNQPTLDECIKEWEERGWTVDELKQFPIIKIWKLNKEQRVVDNIYVFNKTLKSKIDFDADYETLNLLTKTLKALEVNKNDK